MEQLAPQFEERHEFWKPARPVNLAASAPASEHACRQCGGELNPGALFCHVCGIEQCLPVKESSWRRFLFVREIVSLRDAMGHTTASFAALVLGCIFILAALLTGFVFAAVTVLDWQAVQLWRIQWLLAAIAAFIAGILLRRRRD